MYKLFTLSQNKKDFKLWNISKVYKDKSVLSSYLLFYLESKGWMFTDAHLLFNFVWNNTKQNKEILYQMVLFVIYKKVMYFFKKKNNGLDQKICV